MPSSSSGGWSSGVIKREKGGGGWGGGGKEGGGGGGGEGAAADAGAPAGAQTGDAKRGGDNASEEYTSNEMIKNESDGMEKIQPTNNDQ